MSDSPSRTWTSATVRDPKAQAAAVARISIVAGWPTDPDQRLHEIVTDLDRSEALRVFAAEFGHYGSGFASFVEVKLTRRDDSLVVRRDWGVETRGFGLLLSRMAPIAVLQNEASESRSDDSRSGSSSLPDREGLSVCPVSGFPESSVVADVLEQHGYEMADPDLLCEPIADGLSLKTNLNLGPLTAFDAWFYWYD